MGKLTNLRWFDILAVTVIMFGEGIYNSTLQYIALSNHVATLDNNLTFSSADNYRALCMQLMWLFLALIYLKIRKFDFSTVFGKIKITPWLPLQIVIFFVLPALAMDLYHLLSYNLLTPVTPSLYDLQGAFANLDFSLVAYSLLNGFYEEFFFLGLCIAVKPEYAKIAFLYSLLVRCSFHTYQGLGAGIALGLLLGIIFYFLYKKFSPQNLLPFFLAHAIADVIGLSVLHLFW